MEASQFGAADERYDSVGHIVWYLREHDSRELGQRQGGVVSEGFGVSERPPEFS